MDLACGISNTTCNSQNGVLHTGWAAILTFSFHVVHKRKACRRQGRISSRYSVFLSFGIIYRGPKRTVSGNTADYNLQCPRCIYLNSLYNLLLNLLFNPPDSNTPWTRRYVWMRRAREAREQPNHDEGRKIHFPLIYRWKVKRSSRATVRLTIIVQVRCI